MTDEAAVELPAWDEAEYRVVLAEVHAAWLAGSRDAKRIAPKDGAANKVKFTGELATPIQCRSAPRAGLFGATYAARARDANHPVYEAVATQEVKLHALIRAYGHPPRGPDMWKALALALAIDFVPGMKVVFGEPRRRGRRQGTGKSGAPALDRRALYLAVRDRQLTTHLSVSAICANLSRAGQFKGWPKGTLEDAYYRYSRELPKGFGSFGAVMSREPIAGEAEQD